MAQSRSKRSRNQNEECEGQDETMLRTHQITDANGEESDDANEQEDEEFSTQSISCANRLVLLDVPVLMDRLFR